MISRIHRGRVRLFNAVNTVTIHTCKSCTSYVTHPDIFVRALKSRKRKCSGGRGRSYCKQLKWNHSFLAEWTELLDSVHIYRSTLFSWTIYLLETSKIISKALDFSCPIKQFLLQDEFSSLLLKKKILSLDQNYAIFFNNKKKKTNKIRKTWTH